jgi:hypothetical protein
MNRTVPALLTAIIVLLTAHLLVILLGNNSAIAQAGRKPVGISAVVVPKGTGGRNTDRVEVYVLYDDGTVSKR